jgi:hypothetical protein
MTTLSKRSLATSNVSSRDLGSNSNLPKTLPAVVRTVTSLGADDVDFSGSSRGSACSIVTLLMLIARDKMIPTLPFEPMLVAFTFVR